MTRAARVSLPPARLDSPPRTLIEARHAMTAPHPIVPGVRFKAIPGFPGYRVGDDGSVWTSRSSTAKRLKCWMPLSYHVDRGGYICVGLTRDGKTYARKVHSLVLLAFVGPRPRGMWCRHKDSDPSNAALSNLSYATPKENHADKIAMGTSRKGERHHNSKLCDADVVRVLELRKAGMSQAKIAAKFGVSQPVISDICLGRSWTHIPR